MKALLGALFLILPIAVTAATVVPIKSVERFVNIRTSPESGTEIVGRLNKGDALVHLQTVDGWHEVRLPDGGSGFVHGDWANVVADESAVETAIESESVEEEPPSTVDTAIESESDQEEPTSTVDTAIESESDQEELPSTVDTAIESESDQEDPPSTVDTAIESESDQEEPPSTVDTADEPEVIPAEPPNVADEAASITSAKQVAAESASTLKGTRNYLVRFKDEAAGGNSQVFDDGNFVGIGTTAPKQRLEVNGSIQIHEQNSSVAGLMITQSSGETGYVLHNRASTLTIGAGSLDRITIDRDGNVGFGVDRPTHPIEMASGAFVTAGGVWTNSSSRARKRDIEKLAAVDAQQALDGLQAVRFRYKNEPRESYVGFIAEDVPELVAMQGRDSLSTMDIVAVLTRVVQDQQHRIAELEARLEQIE